jgi:hypothetical protein
MSSQIVFLGFEVERMEHLNFWVSSKVEPLEINLEPMGKELRTPREWKREVSSKNMYHTNIWFLQLVIIFYSQIGLIIYVIFVFF